MELLSGSLDSKDVSQELTDSFPLVPFPDTLCKFLDKINTQNTDVDLSQEHDQFSCVKLKATDLVQVVEKERLQEIHKGEDYELRQFLEQHNMNDFFNSDALDSIPQIPHTPAEPITFDFDIIENLDTGSIHNIPTDLLKSESTDIKSTKGTKSSIKLKRKRPHEDTVDAAGKRRAIPSLPWSANFPHPQIISLMPVENGFSKKAFIPHFPGLERAEDFAIQNPCLDGISHKRDDMSPNDSNAPRAAGKTPTGQRKRKRWTDQEVDFLLEGVRLFGVGNWKDIQNHFQFGDRSYVDLKDKYRNLLKHYTTDELLGKTDSLLRPR